MMRDFLPQFLGYYLAHIGENALKSVRSYQIEGDYTTIIDLPLLPLLAFLRAEGVLEF